MSEQITLTDGRELWRVLTGTGEFGPEPLQGAAQLLRVIARHGLNPYALVAWHAQLRPQVTAIEAWDGVRTYRDLQLEANTLAAELAGLIRPGQRVGLLGRGGVRWLVGLLAASRLGADVVLLNTLHSPQEWAQQMQKLNLSAVLHEEAQAQTVRSCPHPAALVNLHATRGKPRATLRLGPRAGAVTLLTSGSTGTPRDIKRTTGLSRLRGVLIATDFLNRLGLRCGERVWLPPPLFHGQGLSALMLTLGFGGTLLLAPEPQGSALRAHLQRTSPQWLIVVPTVLHRLLDGVTAPFHLPHLRGVVSGSAPLSAVLTKSALHAFHGKLFNLYGSTETGPISLATPADLQQQPGTVGRVLRGVKVDLPGGAVQVRSPFLAVPHDCWNTGDLGEWSGSGCLHLLGRADDRFICGGETIDPLALEQRIEALPGVAECAVWPVPDAEYGQAIHALMVPVNDRVTVQEVQAALNDALPRTFRPRSITLCRELPRNAAGKLVRRHLPGWFTALP